MSAKKENNFKVDVIQFRDCGAVYLNGQFSTNHDGLHPSKAQEVHLRNIGVVESRTIHLNSKYALYSQVWPFSENLMEALADILKTTEHLERCKLKNERERIGEIND